MEAETRPLQNENLALGPRRRQKKARVEGKVVAAVAAEAGVDLTGEAKAEGEVVAAGGAAAAALLHARPIRPDFTAPALGVGSPASAKGAAQVDSYPRVPPSVQVRRRVGAWRRIGASPWVVDTITRGIYLPWTSKPSRFRAKGYQVAAADQDFLEKEIARGLSRGFYRELTPTEAKTSHCVVAAFVTHSAGKQRLVIDYRIPNRHLAKRKFKYESLFDLAPQLRRGDAMLLGTFQTRSFTWRSGRKTKPTYALPLSGEYSSQS